METTIRIGRYRHYKGREYKLICIAKNSETLEDMVVYQALYDDHKIWVRPLKMWNETVLNNGIKTRRFEYIGE